MFQCNVHECTVMCSNLQEGYDEQGGRGDNEVMETQEVREAMAEAIGEMEREEDETGGSGNEEQRRAQISSIIN